MTRTAIVLFSLGGPDTLDAVEPFLFNLFNDPAIIGLPGPLRTFLAHRISRRRGPVAREIYAKMGGRSPLLPNTVAQAEALTGILGDVGEVKPFIAMRYWHPMSDRTAAEVKDFAPDRVVLLPLYPQFSTTTTASSLADWQRAAERVGLRAPMRTVCCYPTEAGFVAALAELTRAAIAEARTQTPPVRVRVLFSAHGLPERVVKSGDPYVDQVGRTALAVAASLGLGGADVEVDGVSWRVCFQSRVGPLKWTGPATEEEIARAGADRVAAVIVPVAFVSEHSETLVELDIEYRDLATAKGVPAYVRVPTVSTHPAFIEGLGRLVREAVEGDLAIRSEIGGRLCPIAYARCPQLATRD
jgi:ferrochelatase